MFGNLVRALVRTFGIEIGGGWVNWLQVQLQAVTKLNEYNFRQVRSNVRTVALCGLNEFSFRFSFQQKPDRRGGNGGLVAGLVASKNRQ